MKYLLFHHQSTGDVYFWNGKRVICVSDGDKIPWTDDEAAPTCFGQDDSNTTEAEQKTFNDVQAASNKVRVMNFKSRGKFNVLARGEFKL